MKIVLVFLVGVIMSFFFFPVEFTFLPKGINTKLMLAIIGLPLIGYHFIQLKEIRLSKELLIASMIALLFSLVGFLSIEYNGTTDYSYSTYIVSMWIWFSASYVAVTAMALVHGYVSFRLVVNYLVIICIVQCVLALLIDYIPAIKSFVDTYFVTGDLKFMERVERLYGIGASLDVAGGRFSVVLLMIMVLVVNDQSVRNSQSALVLYIVSFILITVIGNLIARSTTMGMVLGLSYLLIKTSFLKPNIQMKDVRLWLTIFVYVTLFFVIGVYLYRTNPEVRGLLRFGFEGFFSWVETGEWRTASTDKLNETMWVFPDNLKTWIIGDGYFDDPLGKGFYMNTDVGYLRFIFYCGLIGLTVFSVFFIYLSAAMYRRFPDIKHFFLLLIILVFVNWVKVSTDFFLVYAIFLSISSPYLYDRYYRELNIKNENNLLHSGNF